MPAPTDATTPTNAIPTDAMPTDAIVFGGIAPPKPTNPVLASTENERLKIRSILSQNERKGGKEGHAPPISPKLEAQFNEFKAKQMEQEGLDPGMMASTQRAQTTENLRAFSQSQSAKQEKKKEDAKDEAPKKKGSFSFNPMAKSFNMSVKAKAFVPMSSKKPPAPALAQPNPQGQVPHPRPQGFPPQHQGFGPGFQQGGFPQPMQQMPPQPMQPEMAPVEGHFSADHKLLDLYADGMGKMLQSTAYMPEENALPGWPYGNVGFRTADEAARGQPMVQAQMMMGPQSGGKGGTGRGSQPSKAVNLAVAFGEVRSVIPDKVRPVPTPG